MSPGTTTTHLPDGTRRVTTDGRAVLTLDVGPTSIELRLGPDRRGDAIVLLVTPEMGPVTYTLGDLAGDIRVQREIHVGMMWMLRYAVDREQRVLLLAIGDSLGRMLGSETAGKWVALSLDDGGLIEVTDDLVTRVQLASERGREALVTDIGREPARADRLQAIAEDSKRPSAVRVRAFTVLHLAGRPVDWAGVRELLADASPPDDLEARAAAGVLLVAGLGARAKGPLLRVARRGKPGDSDAAGDGLAALVRRGTLSAGVLHKLARGGKSETRRAALGGLTGAEWEPATAAVVELTARDPALADAAGRTLCAHRRAAWPLVTTLLEERGPSEAVLLACLDPAMPRAIELLFEITLRGDAPDDVASVNTALTEALWRSSNAEATRLAATNALLELARDEHARGRFLAIQAVLQLRSHGSDAIEGVAEILASSPPLPWSASSLPLLVSPRSPASALALSHVARTSADGSAAMAARDLLVSTPWENEARATRRQALLALWAERLDLIGPPESLDAIHDTRDRGALALLVRCLAADSEPLRAAAAERLYSWRWEREALEAFKEHLVSTPDPVPWTADLVALFRNRVLDPTTVGGLARAATEADEAVAEDAMARLSGGVWGDGVVDDADAVQAVIALARSGRFRSEARTILRKWRWRDEAKARVDAVSGELGLRQRSRQDTLLDGLNERLLRRERGR